MNKWNGISCAGRHASGGGDYAKAYLGPVTVEIRGNIVKYDAFYYYSSGSKWICCLPVADNGESNNLRLAYSGDPINIFNLLGEPSVKPHHIKAIERAIECGLIKCDHPDYPMTRILEGINYANFGFSTTPRPA